MELTHRITKPKAQSYLKFSEKEIINALKEYAAGKEYDVLTDENITLYWPHDHEKHLTFVVSVSGEIPPVRRNN